MEIYPIEKFEGNVRSSPSKSYSHRAFALALLSKTPSTIVNPLTEGDLGVTIDFCQFFGAKISKEKSKSASSQVKRYKIIPPSELHTPPTMINGKNSGTTIRIMSSLATLCKGDTQIYGMFFDRKRPLQPLLDALHQIGVESTPLENPSGVIIHPGQLKAGLIRIAGDISSQFITGLMILAPRLLGTETTIQLTTPAKSFPYLKITEDIFNTWGIKFTANFTSDLLGTYKIPGNQIFNGKIYDVPGDFSSVAFILVAAALNPKQQFVSITNLDMNSPQGDRVIVDILKNVGSQIEIDAQKRLIKVGGGRKLHGIPIDCSQIPDLFPILCVLAVFCEGTTKIYNAAHVRFKETDRIKVMKRELEKMGATIKENEDGVEITGKQQLHGSHIIHDQDHRIAMALTVATFYADIKSELDNPDVVKDSYPAFFDDITFLGAKIK